MDPILLIVLDGYGIAPPTFGNAVYSAHPTFINSLMYSYPNTQLKASGEAVGLPPGEVGNTEVGHINIGAGKIVYQSLPRINLAIADSSFDKNEALLGAIEHAKKTGGKLHITGLVGDGSVHSCVEHLFALLHLCKKNNFDRVFIHVITDGRDSPPKAAKNYISHLAEVIDSIQIGKIASIMGRYFAMDRDRRWDRIEKAYLCLTKGVGNKTLDWKTAIDSSYLQNKTDEFIEPTNIIDSNQQPIALVEDNDAFIFFNYRIDRPRQLTKAFVLDDFDNQANKASYDPYIAKYYGTENVEALNQQTYQTPFKREKKIENLYFATMTEYEPGLNTHVAFPPRPVNNPLGRILAENDIAQLRMSESEKERFVTYYFNGLREQPFVGEDRLIIPSPKVATYDLQPEMSAQELTNNLISKIESDKYQFILINYANADMVGHTGNLQAGIKAIKTLDNCLSKVVPIALQFNWKILITADHGNAEEMINPKTGEPSTEHSGNPVPFIFVSKDFQNKPIKLQKGILGDIAPTILSLFKIQKPPEMTGNNLLSEIIIE